ncbi:MAG: 30S ribosomal protein S12 methylthiotransferase RimO [Phascolarctobacterium sp.]|nr:30S ribosomal protein S12 methylthiotransferase RimO [Phascolarctobacterium sp.]
MKLGLVSLGCPKNLVDSEVMLGIFKEKRLVITNNPAEAEIIIVNTCGFIESAKEESINSILEMAEYKKTSCCRYLIVTGCLGQRYAKELFRSIPEVDAIVGTECFADIALVIDEVLKGRRLIYLERHNRNVRIPLRILTTPAYMAYLKIAEGCDNCCSYCIIPKLRGPYTSRPYEEVLAEAKALAESGIKEIILVAQDTTRYGEDLYQKLMLPQLLKDLNNLAGIEWIRVMYCYPDNFTDELIDAFASLSKVCKYIDLPLQHANDRLLKRMNRRDTKAGVEVLLEKIRNRIPNIVIRTTFIVGFPGETEADFNELKNFLFRQSFENAGVFKYSQEEGTVAEKMADQIDEDVKEARYHELMSIQTEISEKLHKKMEGEELTVVVEGFDGDNLAVARSYREAPDIDGSIYIENAAGLNVGDFVKVRILEGFTYEMVAEKI